MPFLGVLQDRKLPHVPGTVILEEDAAGSQGVTGGLKHGTGRNAKIVLVPQPSHDPNDPLNWTYMKKLTVLSITLSGAILYAAVISAMLNPAFVTIAIETHSTVPEMVLATGYQTLVVGVTGPIFNAIARKYGKRPVFLFGSIICLIADIVGSALPTYRGILISRVLQGFSIAPYESLIFTLISDLFFVHERGIYTAVINFILAGISNLTAVVSGPIATQLGWEWIYYLMVLFGGIQTILQFLFVPETSYVRDHRLEIDEVIEDNLEEVAAFEHQEHQEHLDLEKTNITSTHVEASSTASPSPHLPAKKTFRQNLAVYNGTFSNENLFQLFIAPFAVVANIAVSWILLVNSMMVVFYVVVAFVLAQLFAAPPYLLNPTAIGYLSFGPFVGGLIAALIVGATSDPLIKWCARKNNGVYEPEYRLIPAFLGVMAGAAMMGWGVAVSDGLSPYTTATLHGVQLAGTIFICVGTSAYAIDAFREMTAEIFIASMAVKNMVIYGFSYFVNTWTAEAGVRHCFFIWGAISLALAVTVPITFVFGKRYRSYWARHNLLVKWGIRTHTE